MNDERKGQRGIASPSSLSFVNPTEYPSSLSGRVVVAISYNLRYGASKCNTPKRRRGWIVGKQYPFRSLYDLSFHYKALPLTSLSVLATSVVVHSSPSLPAYQILQYGFWKLYT